MACGDIPLHSLAHIPLPMFRCVVVCGVCVYVDSPVLNHVDSAA